MAGSVSRWIDASSEPSDEAVASLITSEKVHILIDVNGHSKGARLGVLLHRPAPGHLLRREQKPLRFTCSCTRAKRIGDTPPPTPYPRRTRDSTKHLTLHLTQSPCPSWATQAQRADRRGTPPRTEWRPPLRYGAPSSQSLRCFCRIPTFRLTTRICIQGRWPSPAPKS